MKAAYRHWVGRCCYPGKKPFLFGTVQAETELEALRALDVLWAEISPHAMPPEVAMLPGLLAFHPEER